jgi:hypothetical protein
VKWDEPALPNGGEPEHPAPVLALAGDAPAAHDMAPATTTQATAAPPAAAPPSHSTSDDTARWLAGAALILAAFGVVAAFVRARRT